ncbi:MULTISPECIES: hypothetical protein [Nocardia]|uniref:hypothetical protein n=1 Tax=Nocardia TaxID=1817 RepID=UPI00030C24ED|nr:MULTISPECIES: hypothetical protein [Nocardia]
MSEDTHDGLSRREAMALARRSRRPSRLQRQAGVTPVPDRVLDRSAGFPTLLASVWKSAAAAADVDAAVSTLLTLDRRVPADIGLRALPAAERAALQVTRGLGWDIADRQRSAQASGFLGALGLTTTGRVVVGVPDGPGVAERDDLVDGVFHLRWAAADVEAYRDLAERAAIEDRESVSECRAWLAAAGSHGREQLLDELIDAARRTAPFVLYREDQLYTNFRERNNLAGKTLFAGHPDCVLSALRATPLPDWSDAEAMVVVCLSLLIGSGGYARIEEVNGTQIDAGNLAELLDRTRRSYNAVPGATPIPAVTAPRIAALHTLAQQLRTRRGELTGSVQLYREIYGPLMHKIERVAAAPTTRTRDLEAALCSRLRECLPLEGETFIELGHSLAAAPQWLIQPHGDFGTGLESLIYETVAAAREGFAVDFAMSRGLRGLSALIEAMRVQDWPTIVGWELPEYFCCVVPDPRARRFFGDDSAALADIAWSMSARMQYNSWHFLAGNLPKTDEVLARDYFVAPGVPDIAYYSDQHHHGHVAARVRFSIRSPQPVTIDGHRFGGFVDLRLLRCESDPFTEPELLAAHRTSGFIAAATGHAASLSARRQIRVAAFDPAWHWATIATPAVASFPR